MQKIILLSFFVFLSGCVSTSPKKDTTKDLTAPLITQKLAESTEAEVRTVDIKLDIVQSRLADQAIIHGLKTEKYLNDIAKKLLKGSPRKTIIPHVFIVSSEGYNATARENGGIFIPIETLSKIESEDELAALLAHEVSHVILDHKDDNLLEGVSKKAISSARLAMKYKQKMKELMANAKGDEDATESKSDKKTRQQLKLTQLLMTNAFFPSWKRGQESEADILAADLLIRAGYSLNGMKAFFAQLKSYETEKFNEIFPPTLMDTIKEDPSSLLTTDTDKWKEMFREITDQGVNSLIKSISGKKHEKAEKRMQRVNEYVRKFYADRDRPDMDDSVYAASVLNEKTFKARDAAFKSSKQSSFTKDEGDLVKAEKQARIGVSGANSKDSYARMAFYQIRTEQKRYSPALLNLDIALKSKEASHSVYYYKYIHYLTTEKYELALKALDDMDMDLGKQESYIPNKLDAALKAKLTEKVSSLRAECLKVNNKDLDDMCDTVMKGEFEPM